jgi:Ca2+-binding EF-hand superfamily protein
VLSTKVFFFSKLEDMGNQHQHQLEEDLSLNDYRYLMKQTHLTPHVIQGWYREFLTVCPNGQLSKNQFIKFYKELENSSVKNVESIAENVFQAFDHNGLFLNFSF